MITQERSIEITETYYNDVLKFCRSELKNDIYAEDITQDVFLLFQKRYNELDDRNIKSWLFNVAQKKLLEHFRKLKKEAETIPLAENADYLTDSSLLTEINEGFFISDEEIEEQKSRILERLTPEERRLFKMIYIQHLNYSEIAEISHTTANAIALRALRMRQKIKKMAAEAFIIVLLIIFFFIF